MAKLIIRFIHDLAATVNANPRVRDLIKVVFLPDYRVSLAERIIPAAELSEQISLAGMEASGTGNMKFMMNGALTVGTLDGANVEMHEKLGDENMFLFGMHADEVVAKKARGYMPQMLYMHNDRLHRVIDQLKFGFGDGVSYEDLAQRLLMNDEYMLLEDFDSYCDAQARVEKAYADQKQWNRMALINVARSGIFAADRAVAEYADNIWHVPHR